jgi:hypothetical protein
LAQVRVHADGTIEEQEVPLDPTEKPSSLAEAQAGDAKNVKCDACCTAVEQNDFTPCGTKVGWKYQEMFSFPISKDTIKTYWDMDASFNIANFVYCETMG